MASSHSLSRRRGQDFKQRFDVKCNVWNESISSQENQVRDVITHEEDRVETVSALPEHEIHGFRNEAEVLENILLDQKVKDEFKSIVVVGEYGVGKTTLCKMIFNSTSLKNVYAPRIWISMHSKESIEWREKKICVLRKILKVLGVEDSILASIKSEAHDESMREKEDGKFNGETTGERERSALLYALHLNLQWKKYLIVIDDVRETDNWGVRLDKKLKEGEEWGKHLSDGFPKGSGGRVIYTTRDENLAKKLVAEEHEIHRLCPLSDPESVWKIYKSVIEKIYTDIPRKDEKCIDELMNKSRGLPLAIRSMAKLNPVFIDKDFINQRLSESISQEDVKLDSKSG